MLMEELEKSGHCILLMGDHGQSHAWEELFNKFRLQSYLLISTARQEGYPADTAFRATQKTIGCRAVSRSGVLTGWPCLVGAEIVLILDGASSVLGAHTWPSQVKTTDAHLSVITATEAISKLVLGINEAFRLDSPHLSEEEFRSNPVSSRGSALVLSNLGSILVEMELSLREAQLLSLVDYYVEMEGTQNRFRREKLEHLGPKVEELLRLRAKSLGQDVLSRESQVYETANREYARFSESFKVAREKPSVTELSENAHEELKRLYKKGSLLCHPDRVAEEHKARATELFQQLSGAYREANLEGVREILDRIDQEGFGASSPESPFDPTVAALALIRLREAISTKVHEVWGILSSEEWHKVEEYDDWNSYFEEEQRRLDEKIDKIKGVGI
tara:strand:+ start:309 stop:1478 length:1170 start_codon:yes stop_codon:yes gene_type:complete